MDLIVSYIGFTQALISSILILTKKPLKTAYFFLSAIILVFAVMYGLDILQNYHIVPADRKGISLCLTLTYAPLLYLYAKYITQDYDKFSPKDHLHFIPSLALLLIFLFLKALPENHAIPFHALPDKYFGIEKFFGYLQLLQLILYPTLALVIIIRFKKRIIHNYSFNSEKVSLNWVIVIIILFFVFFALIIISSMYTLLKKSGLSSEAIIARHLSELFFVYILGIWGYSQNQLSSSVYDFVKNYDQLVKGQDATSEKYQKSGLKNIDVENHIQTLLLCMQDSEVWKDSELSINKLANLTTIPKYHISEVLNVHMGKSFYVFVNEYRIEYAKKLLTNKKYNVWSIQAIAYECGFNSKAAFNSFFKKHTHLTPSEFKKSHIDNLQ